jgi:hypothetical protein
VFDEVGIEVAECALVPGISVGSPLRLDASETVIGAGIQMIAVVAARDQAAKYSVS